MVPITNSVTTTVSHQVTFLRMKASEDRSKGQEAEKPHLVST